MQEEKRFILKDIVKKYGNHSVGPINFEVFEREFLALVGETGCGKTTVANIIMRLDLHNSGELIYKGKAIEETGIKEFRKVNQIMFQNHLLSVNPLFKIKKIIEEPLIIEKYDRGEIDFRVEEYLEILELPRDVLNKYPSEVSGGQLQRIVLLRALVLKPEFIILDEPFSNLEEDLALRLINVLVKLREGNNFGLFVISHSIRYLNKFTDRIVEFSKLLQPEYF